MTISVAKSVPTVASNVVSVSAESERQLGRRIVSEYCPSSRERLASASLPLVEAIAKRYLGRGLGLASLMEEGRFGLLCAVGEFDPAQCARFSTHASWWIKRAIKRALPKADLGPEVRTRLGIN